MGWVFDFQIFEDGENYFLRLYPGGVESRVDGAFVAFLVGRGGIGKVLLLVGCEVKERVCEGVGSAEGDDDARVLGGVGDGDVPTGVSEGEAGVPGL